MNRADANPIPNPNTIALFCPNLIGDTVMATPTIRALRHGFPNARLIAVGKAPVMATLDGNPWIDDWIVWDPRSKDPSRRTVAVVTQLRTERPDLAILLPNSFRSGLVAWLSGARRRVGYARGGRGPLLTDRLKAPRTSRGRFLPTPQVEYYVQLVRRIGCPVDSLKLELRTTPSDEQTADRAWSDLGLNDGRSVICLNSGGAFGPSKNWPRGSFATLARRLVEERDASVLVVCGPAERESAEAIVAMADSSRVRSLADQPLSVGLSKACIRRAALLVTTDSGPRHFATAFGTPVVGLFGPTHIAWTRTHHPQGIHLQHRVPCGPCQQPVCPLGHNRCMTELTPDRVMTAIDRLLGERNRPVAPAHEIALEPRITV